MTGKERVMKTLKGEIPDRVPRGELLIEEAFIAAYLGKGPRLEPEAEIFFYEEAGLDLACHSREETLAYFAPRSSLFLFGLINGGLGPVVEARGFSETMINIATRPDEVRQQVEANCRKNVEKGLRLAASGAQALIIGDDIAYNKGTYMSARTLKEVLFPGLAGMVAAFREEGLSVFFHSDGNYQAVLQDLADCGFSGIQCLEEGAGMRVSAAKEALPPPFCLMGGLDLSYVNPHFQADRLHKKIAALMEAGKPGGSYIFGTNGGLSAREDPKAAARMFRLSRQYGDY